MMKILQLLGMYFFCHINIVKPIPSNNKIIEIPPAIADRLLYSSSNAITTSKVPNLPRSRTFTLFVIKEGSNYYFASSEDISSYANYIVSYYILKDI